MYWDASSKRWNKTQGNVATDGDTTPTDRTTQVPIAGATANVASTGTTGTTNAQSRRVIERTLESLMTQVQNLS